MKKCRTTAAIQAYRRLMSGQVITDKSGKGGQATLAWVIAIVSVGYMLPWAIAASRGKSNSGSIGWLNLFLGWTVIGWIVALVMACGQHQAVAYQAPPPNPYR